MSNLGLFLDSFRISNVDEEDLSESKLSYKRRCIYGDMYNHTYGVFDRFESHFYVRR